MTDFTKKCVFLILEKLENTAFCVQYSRRTSDFGPKKRLFAKNNYIFKKLENDRFF